MLGQWQSIVCLDEQPVLRNLLITQGYHELSRGFARMLGSENVTWFSFASWSSKTVGGFLQQQHCPFGIGGVASLREVRRFLARGNTEVFAELAPVFGRFLEQFGSDREPDARKLEQFLATLRFGSSAPDDVAVDPHTGELGQVSLGGQAPLRRAVQHYYQARFEGDAKRKAEQILLANAHIGVHEQTRLDTYIRGALDAPVNALFSRPAAHARALFRRFATERLLTLELPDGSVRLGRDLPAAPGQPLFPRMLEELHHPELGSIFSHYRSSRRSAPRGRVPGTAAQDWTSVHQRMRFILELFRSRQQNPRLLEPTFSRTQVAALREGRVPEGPLVLRNGGLAHGLLPASSPKPASASPRPHAFGDIGSVTKLLFV